MAKVLCVLYDDPRHGYPTSYARDDIATIESYPGGRSGPPTSPPGRRGRPLVLHQIALRSSPCKRDHGRRNRDHVRRGHNR